MRKLYDSSNIAINKLLGYFLSDSPEASSNYSRKLWGEQVFVLICVEELDYFC